MLTKDLNDLDVVTDILDPNNFIDDEHLTDSDTPETLLLKNNMFEDVSREAQEFVELILNAPIEFQELLYNIYGGVSIHTLTMYFKKLGWKRSRILQCLRELNKCFGDNNGKHRSIRPNREQVPYSSVSSN